MAIQWLCECLVEFSEFWLSTIFSYLKLLNWNCTLFSGSISKIQLESTSIDPCNLKSSKLYSNAIQIKSYNELHIDFWHGSFAVSFDGTFVSNCTFILNSYKYSRLGITFAAQYRRNDFSSHISSHISLNRFIEPFSWLWETCKSTKSGDLHHVRRHESSYLDRLFTIIRDDVFNDFSE